MCGRFALTASPDEVARAAGIERIDGFPPRYNVAPTQPVLTVIDGPANRRQALLVRWGLVPSWVEDPSTFSLLVNARAETAARKPSFRNALNHRRALVPASGYYEWRRPPAGGATPAQPHWIRPRDGGVVFLGALVETWSSKDGSEIDTGAILTTAACDDLSPVSDRMPLVVRQGDIERWLDCRNFRPDEIGDLLAPVPAGTFEAVPVGPKVNAIANTGPDIQEPAGPPIGVPRTRPGGSGRHRDEDEAPGEQIKLL